MSLFSGLFGAAPEAATSLFDPESAFKRRQVHPAIQAWDEPHVPLLLDNKRKGDAAGAVESLPESKKKKIKDDSVNIGDQKRQKEKKQKMEEAAPDSSMHPPRHLDESSPPKKKRSAKNAIGDTEQPVAELLPSAKQKGKRKRVGSADVWDGEKLQDRQELAVTAGEENRVKDRKSKKKRLAAGSGMVPSAKLLEQEQPRPEAVLADEVGEVHPQDLAVSGVVEGLETGPPALRKLTEEEEAEKLRRTVFVGNLPASVRPKAVKKLFDSYGKVESVRLRSLPVNLQSKMSRRASAITRDLTETRAPANAYVVFSTAEAAAAALQLNMAEFEGQHLRVDTAARKSGEGTGRAPVEYDCARSVFLGNLAFDAKEEDIIRLFNERLATPLLPEPVVAVRVVRDRATNIGRGVGYVLLRTKAVAREALALAGVELGKRQLRVSKPKPGAVAVAAGPAPARVAFNKGKPEFEKRVKAVGAESWQGARTKGQGKVVLGGAARRIAASGGGGQKEDRESQNAQKALPKGKRPSVALRKAKNLGLKVKASTKAKFSKNNKWTPPKATYKKGHQV